MISNPTPSAPVETIGERLENALGSVPELENAAIHPRIEGGRVTLEGTVDCDRDRILASRAAWSVDGVRMVEDNLRVVRPEPAG